MDFDFSFQKLWFDGKIQKGNSTIYCWEQFHSFNDDAILQPKLGNFSQCQGKNAQGQAGVVDMVLVFQLNLLISNAMRHLPIGKIELLLIKVRVLTKGWCDISCRINCKLFLKYPQYTNSLVVKFRWQLVAWESSECWWVSLSEEKTSFWLGKYVHNVSNSLGWLWPLCSRCQRRISNLTDGLSCCTHLQTSVVNSNWQCVINTGDICMILSKLTDSTLLLACSNTVAAAL